VLVKQPKLKKLTAPYRPEKLTVLQRNHSWVLAKGTAGNEIKRNVSFFKLLPDKIVDIAQPLPGPTEAAGKAAKLVANDQQADRPVVLVRLRGG